MRLTRIYEPEAPEHLQLVPEDEELDPLRPLTTSAEHEQLEEAA
jgi:hypothetical protein